ncbi:MAG: GHMP kinase [Eubacteriaceae bacterium]|jgi:L-threonine kinase
MRVCSARAPGTCGEYIQGIIHGEPCLVSSPVNLYSRAQAWIDDREGNRICGDKTERAVNLLAQRFELPAFQMDHLHLEVCSEIPQLKGMASSTADICAAVTATAGCFDLRLTPEQTASLCLAVEPSDNLMYPQLNLFSHYSGEVFDDFDCVVRGEVLAIDFVQNVSTLELGREAEYRKTEADFAPCISLLREGARTQDLGKIGRAVTLSARLNQGMLYKPRLETIIRLAEQNGGCGVMIGHSGSIVGIIHDAQFDENRFTEQFRAQVPRNEYIGFRHLELIPGGVAVQMKTVPECF